MALDRHEVVLVDGSRLRPDAVICATGYRRGLEPLAGHLGVLRPDGVPVAHCGAPEHPAAPRLYFAGMWGQFSGEIRLGPIHARRIARVAARSRAQLGAAEPAGKSKSKRRHASLAAVMTSIGRGFPASRSRGRSHLGGGDEHDGRACPLVR